VVKLVQIQIGQPSSFLCTYLALCLLLTGLVLAVPADRAEAQTRSPRTGTTQAANSQMADAVIREFVVPKGISSPHNIAVGALGKVWFTEKVGKNLVMFEPEGQTFEAHPLPPEWGDLGPARLAIAPDGAIWFSVRRWANSLAGTWLLGRFDPASGAFDKYNLTDPDAAGASTGPAQGNVSPDDLLVDRKGTVWFLSPKENKLYSFAPDGAGPRGYPIPTPNCYPKGIAIDGGGTIWFVEANANKIGKFAPGTGKFAEYQIPTAFANPETLTVDGSGKVWFVELRTNRLSVLHPQDGRFYEALIPTTAGLPNAIAVGGDGKIWFLEYMGNKVGVFDPVPARFTEFDIPTFASLPGDMAIDAPRRRIWFSETNTESKRLGLLAIDKAWAVMARMDTQAEVATEAGANTATALPIHAVTTTPIADTIVVTLLAALVAALFGVLILFWRRRTA
jgi:virginiamycin B lyase